MKLDYDIVYSDRRTIRITVERDRRVVVRAPHRASPDAVRALVERKRFWIWDKLRSPRKYPEPPPRKEFVAGETFFWLGQTFPLELVAGRSEGLHFTGRRFELALSAQPRAHDLFVAWYVAAAKAHLLGRIGSLAQSMGISFQRIAVRRMRYRWASCSPQGTISFNWRIVQAPLIVVDYLVVHELAHVREPHHSAEFWNVVAVHAPAAGQAREWLTQHGSHLEW